MRWRMKFTFECQYHVFGYLIPNALSTRCRSVIDVNEYYCKEILDDIQHYPLRFATMCLRAFDHMTFALTHFMPTRTRHAPDLPCSWREGEFNLRKVSRQDEQTNLI